MIVAYKIQQEFLKALEAKNSWGKNEIRELYISTVNRVLLEYFIQVLEKANGN